MRAMPSGRTWGRVTRRWRVAASCRVSALSGSSSTRARAMSRRNSVGVRVAADGRTRSSTAHATGATTSPRQSTSTHALSRLMTPASKASPVARSIPPVTTPTLTSRFAIIRLTPRAMEISSAAELIAPFRSLWANTAELARRAANPALKAAIRASIRCADCRHSSHPSTSERRAFMVTAGGGNADALSGMTPVMTPTVRIRTDTYANTRSPLHTPSLCSAPQ